MKKGENQASILLIGGLIFFFVATFTGHEDLIMFLVTIFTILFLAWCIMDSISNSRCHQVTKSYKRKKIRDDFIREMAKLEQDKCREEIIDRLNNVESEEKYNGK